MTSFVDDPDFTLYLGDVTDVLADLPDESVHCVVTSPPYWGLRDYSTEGQIGLEPTPNAYVRRMVEVFREVRRVLRRDGTVWLNLGDSYAAGGGFSPDAPSNQARLEGKAVGALHGASGANYMARANGPKKAPAGLKPKDLVGIPWRVAFALQADGWYLRSDIIWAKPNPMPESVTDRPTKAHEYLFLLTKSARYFYDADAIREPAEWARWGDQTNAKYEGTSSGAGWIGNRSKADLRGVYGKGENSNRGDLGRGGFYETNVDGGRNARSVWGIATQPYPEAHFATFPEELPRRCIAAGTSEKGCCPECGAPWERETEIRGESTYARILRESGRTYQDLKREAAERGITPGNVGNVTEPGQRGANYVARERQTLGWLPTCDHTRPPIPCTVLDIFMGSGTTALVARKLGRRSIGIELSPEYAQLAARRLSQLSLFAEEVS